MVQVNDRALMNWGNFAEVVFTLLIDWTPRSDANTDLHFGACSLPSLSDVYGCVIAIGWHCSGAGVDSVGRGDIEHM